VQKSQKSVAGTTRSARKRGQKSKLPPRVPASRRVPRLLKSQSAGDNRPAKLDNFNFQTYAHARLWHLERVAVCSFDTPEILRTLGLVKVVPNDHQESDEDVSRNEPDKFDKEVFDGAMVHINVQNEIQEIVADYCADKAQQIKPDQFRFTLDRFQRWLEKADTCFPPPHGPLTEALEQQLDMPDETLPEGPDLEDIRRGLDRLLTAAKRLTKSEAGGGRDADRAKHLLIKGFAAIFEKHTGLNAKKSYWIARESSGDKAVKGPFADFVKAVNKEIPNDYQIVGLQNLFNALD
jgi:hypothetical protein